MPRKLVRIAVVAALTVGLLALWLSSVDLPAMGRALVEALPGWIAAAAAASLLHLVVRAWRWRLLLGPSGAGAARYPDLLSYMVIGYAVTFVIPGRAGEVVRPALLWRRGGVPFGRALGSVLLERILDVATVGAFLAVFVVLEPERSPPFLRAVAGTLLGSGAVALVVLTLLARRHRGLADRLVARLVARLPARFRSSLGGFADALLDGLDSAFRDRGPLPILGASLLTWLPVALGLHAGTLATSAAAPVSAPLALVPLTALGIAVPTPAGVGGYHAAMTWGLEQLFAVDAGRAAAAAVVTHAASVLPVVVAGLYACWREGLSLSALRREAAGAPTKPESSTP